MKTARTGIALGLMFACAGCAVPTVQIQTQFDYSEHKRYLEEGENSIKGHGFLRQQGGSVVTCAGSPVFMMPATPFFREVVGHYRAGRNPTVVATLDPAFAGVIKRSQCDSQGNFFFTKFPNGQWFVVTEVNWVVGYNRQGGSLLIEVNLSNNETTQILLTDKDFFRR